MLGLESPGIYCAYVCAIVSACVCVVYGIVNWNKRDADEHLEAAESIWWEEKEQEFDKQL